MLSHPSWQNIVPVGDGREGHKWRHDIGYIRQTLQFLQEGTKGFSNVSQKFLKNVYQKSDDGGFILETSQALFILTHITLCNSVEGLGTCIVQPPDHHGIHSQQAHHMHITCTPHAHHMHTTCTSHAHHMHTTCTSHAHHMHITCTPHAHHMHTTSHAHHMHITCILHAHHMHITCTPHAHHMHITCTSHAHHMHITCILHAHHMHITCTSHRHSLKAHSSDTYHMHYHIPGSRATLKTSPGLKILRVQILNHAIAILPFRVCVSCRY